MKINNEMQESIHRESDANYKEAAEMIEEKSKLEAIAKMDIERDLSS